MDDAVAVGAAESRPFRFRDLSARRRAFLSRFGGWRLRTLALL